MWCTTILDYISEKVLCAIFVSIITIWSLLYVVTAPTEYKVKLIVNKMDQLCTTEECVRISSELKSSIDFSVDPCDDFYHFTCGRWLQTHSESSLSKDEQIKLNNRIKNLLSYQNNHEADAVKKAKAFYKSCRDNDPYQERSHPTHQVFKLFLEEAGLPLIPRFFTDRSTDESINWMKIEIASKLIFGESVLLKLTYNAIFFNQIDESFTDPSSGDGYIADYEDALMVHSWMEYSWKSLDRHLSYVESIVDYYTLDRALDLMDIFQRNYNRKLDEYKSTQQKLYLIDELERELRGNNINISESWNELLKFMKKNSMNGTYIDLNEINEMFQFLNGYNGIVVELYFWNKFSAIIEQYYGDLFIDEDCLNVVTQYMGWALVGGLENDYLDSASRDNIKEIFSNIRNVYNISAFEQIELYFGYPDWVSDLGNIDKYYEKVNISQEDFKGNLFQLMYLLPNSSRDTFFDGHMNPLIVNAYYDGANKILGFPMAIFSFPYYHLGLSSLNYGSIGTIIAHEIVHAIENTLSFHNYTQIINCITEQYEIINGDEKMDASLKEHENLADTGSIYLAFSAYKNQKNNESSNESKTLIGFEKYTDEQMFFITYAYHWCGFDKVDHEDTHSSSRYRIVSALQNSYDFSNAFSCPLGSRMNPDFIKCVIF